MKGTGDQSLITGAEFVRHNHQDEVIRSLIFQVPTEYNVTLKMCTHTQNRVLVPNQMTFHIHKNITK